MSVNFRGQSYASIKKECVAKGILFEDPEFPATGKSLYYSKITDDIVWMRPKELCKVPRLVVDGVTCDDLVTGEIKNSWFITACTALAHHPNIWKQVVLDSKSQEFDDKNQYAGIFKFHFWRFGQPTEVVIDDRLPTRDGNLVFVHSKQKNGFWSALLEKAYAKLFGDYETLGAGHTSDALVDFTGGISEKLEMKNFNLDDPAQRKSFFNKMEAASANSALINCHIRPTVTSKHAVQPPEAPAHLAPAQLMEEGEATDGGGDKTGEELSPEQKQKQQRQAFEALAAQEDTSLIGSDGPHGLVVGQGYNVTMVKSVEVKKSLQAAVGANTLQLVRLFNPWSPKEWTGPWSDSSKEWKTVCSNEWSKMGVKFDAEGEFWMSFDDWCQYFSDVDICHFVNTSYFSLKKTWHESICFSEWATCGRNGGNNWNSLSFLSNPQYMFDVLTDDPDTIMVSLEQRDVTEGRVAVGDKKNTIGFYIMKVEANRMYRVHINGEQVFQSQFLTSRNVFGECTLERGRYVVVPCCANPGGVGDFMLRLYTTAKCNGKLLNSECPGSGCCSGKAKLVTTITVDNIDGLTLSEGTKGTLDPYIIIKCEGEKVQSDPQYDNRPPKFNLSATFYRKKPAENIIIEVYNRNTLFDDFLGEARVDWAEITDDPYGTEKGDNRNYNLYGRGKEADVVKPGNVSIFIRSSDDLQML